MAKKKKKDDLNIKNTLLNVANTAKDIAIKSNSASKSTPKNTNTTNTNNNVSVPRPTTTLANATNKVLSTSKKTSSVQKPVIKAPNVSSVSSSPKIQQMSENSAKWHQAEIQKRLPNANVAALTQKQQELHNQNVKLAGNALKFNPSGTWKNPISGQKAYDIGKVNQNSVFLPYLPSVETLKTENKVAENPFISNKIDLPFNPDAKSVIIGGKEYKIADTAVPYIMSSKPKNALDEVADFAKWIKDNTIAGVTGASSALTKTADLILPDFLTPKPLQDYLNWNANYADEQKAKATETNSKGGTASNIVGEIYQAGVQMIPSAVAALASGGSSTASQIGQAGSSIASLLQSPAFWTSFAQTAGSEYHNAKENGANELQASLTGMTSGAVGGAIERMGGIDTLLGNKAQGVLRTAAEEAGEEVLQDITSGLINKAAYDTGREWFGTGDSDAVINPQRLAMNAGAGAILGGAVGGVNAAINSRANINNTITDAKQAVSNPESAVVDVKVNGQSVSNIEIPTPIDTQFSTSYIKINPKTHTLNQIQQINKYINSTDKYIVQFINDVKSGKTQNSYQLSDISDKAAKDIYNAIGVDASGFKTKLEPRIIKHILQRHGDGGTADNSMSDVNDIARMQYILDNYDYIIDGGNVQSYKEPKPNQPSKTRGAKSVIYAKKIDGTYYLVQAVPNTKKKTSYIVSAYIQKKEAPKDNLMMPLSKDISIHDVSYDTSGYTSENDSTNLTTNNILHNLKIDNTTPPTLLTVAQNHIDNMLSNTQSTQNTSVLSNQTLQNNTSVNVENVTSKIPLQVPTLRTVAENHINEVIAQNNQNATNSQSETVGQIIDNAIADSQNTKTTTNSNTAVDTQQDVDVANILSAWDTVREFDKQIANFEDRVSFTQRDLKKIKAALLADDKSIVSTADNPQDALYMVELKSLRNNAYKPISDYNQANSSSRNIQAMQWADYIAQYATDKAGWQYFLETPERNIYDIFGKNKHLADEFIDTFFTPVHKDVAKRNKIANDYRSRVRNLKLDKHESAIVQYMIENELAGAKQYIADHKIKMTDKRTAKIDNAVTEFRAIYKEVLDKINTALIRNGYEPVQSLGDFYAPHFIEKLSDRKLARLAYWLKIKITKKDQLPTDLAGVTEMNRPGKKWSGNLEHRKGTKTIYDAVRGFDQYIETVSDVIALTDSIQRLRSLEDAVRYRLSDEGTQMEIDAVKNDIELNALQKREGIEKIYNQEQTNVEKIKQFLSQKDAGMRNFVTELRRYTDNLAGKKARGDRGIEDIIGREVYEISKQVQNRITLDLLGANIASALTNFIPLTQATGEIEMPYLIKGMYDTLKNVAKDDGFIDASTFLTNRIGSKPINQSFGQKFINKSMWVMEAIDYIVSNTIVRAKTNQNIQNGMDLDSAIDEADSFAASLMADRSKGAMPAVFEIQNPLIKPFTMFQLEVNNQLRYLGKDIPRRLGEQGGQAIAAALTNIFFMSFIGNEVFEKLMGRRPAFDPAGIIKNAMNVYYDVSKNTSDKIEQITTPFVQQLPFVGGMLDGGRVPISAVFPKLPNLWEGFNSELAPEKRKDLIMTELSKPFFSFVLPVGGNAIKRGIEGFNMIRNGGEYRLNDNGEEQLMFAAPGDTPNDYLKAMLFGKYSNENGQNYINNGFQVLSPEYTQKYKKLISDEYGIDNNTAYDALMAVANAPSDEKRAVLMNTPLPADAKSYLDWTLFSYADSGNRIDYSDKDHFNITTQIDSDFLDNALYLYDNLGLKADEVINLIKTSSFESINQVGSKKDQIFNVLNNIYELNVSDDLKTYAYTEILAPQISEKFTTEQGKQLLEGVPMREAIRSYYMRDIINDEIDNDNTIHPLDKKDYKTLGWQNYLAENALEENMTFEQREKLRYFLANGQSEFEKTWDDYVYGGNEKERENIESLRSCGLDTLTYQVIKSGISDFKADKDANGEPIDDSKKNKVSAYFKQWNLTDEQYALMMKLQGYKVGSSSSKKKSSSSKKSSGGRNSKPKVKGGFSDFSGF